MFTLLLFLVIAALVVAVVMDRLDPVRALVLGIVLIALWVIFLSPQAGILNGG